MRMRPHVEAGAQQEFRRTHLIEEDEWAHHLPLAGGKRPAHFEAAEIACARNYHRLDRVAGEVIARRRILRGLPAHYRSPRLKSRRAVEDGPVACLDLQ